MSDIKGDIPKAIQRLAYNSIYKYSLLLWLDKEAYVEINDDDKARFDRLLKRWKSENLPALQRSVFTVYLVKNNEIISSL
jgi:hypothetical protein